MMKPFKARYPPVYSSDYQFETSAIGNTRDCKFYITDRYNFFFYSDIADTTGMAFRVAYDVATRSKNNKELCASVGSMLCAVSQGFKISVEAALRVLRSISVGSQFFKHMASNVQQLKVEHSRFPTLIAVAQELEKEINGPNVSNSVEETSPAESNPMVQALVRTSLAFQAMGLRSRKAKRHGTKSSAISELEIKGYKC
ncbi:hypothetical protein SESBI_18877 [Sesbania bispinosa]|nr:hypothetical protein SESBI_18877 [Sesbania bispinosa]